jgi:hypothetical protein
MKKAVAIFALLALSPSFADDSELDAAISDARQNCSGIAEKVNRMKITAGINTAVTGAGTLAGGGAIATGFVKRAKDKQIASLEDLLKQLEEAEIKYPEAGPTEEDINAFKKSFAEALSKPKDSIEPKTDKTDRESRALGNWRTGLMAGNAAANVAGAVIAGVNRADRNLTENVDGCKTSVKALDRARMQAIFDGADAGKLAIAEEIIKGCGRWNSADLSKIDNRAAGAMWAAIAGAAIGGGGTATSAIANSNKIRGDNTDGGRKTEKNLNTASNAMAIGATAASAAATIFNAAQIAAINKAGEAADACEEAMK